MIAFTVSLTPNDWDSTRTGWRSPVLKIPGAQVDTLYVQGHGQVDKSWYTVDADQEIVRWARADVPQAAALAVKLTQDLAPKFWRNLAIVVPIITALISAAGAYAVKKQGPDGSGPSSTQKPALSSTAIAAPYYERWTVTGRVLLGGQSAANEKPVVHSTVRPPDIFINPNGKFEAEIPVLLKGDGDRQFPSLTFTPFEKDHQAVTVELDDVRSGAENPGGFRGPAKDGSPSKEISASKDGARRADSGYVRQDFQLDVQPGRKRIVIGVPIVLAPLRPYSSERAAIEQRSRAGVDEAKK